MRDPSGRPVPGVEVRMSGSGGEFAGETDEQGSVVFPSVPRGSYTVTAARAGFEALRLPGVQARPAGFLDLRLEPVLDLPRPEAPQPPPPRQPAAEDDTYQVVEVFYGTDRDRRPGESDPRRVYGGDRGELRLGTVEVSIPRDHRLGELESPRWWRLELRPDPESHVALLELAEYPEEEFVARLRARIDDTDHREAFVFVHGYNVTFADAARRTAQIAYDIHHDLVPILFSWPSRGRFAAYPVDETNVRWATPHLRDFLVLVAERSGAEEVHVIAHSMGSRAVADALQELELRRAAGEGLPRFDQIVLVAPDIDAGLFVDTIGPRLVPAGERVTLYGSTRDRALAASRRFHGYPRIGDLSGGAVPIPGIDLVDASSVDTSLLGHSYYAEATSIIADLFHLLRAGLPPASRPPLEPVPAVGGTYWRFPN